MRNDQGSVQTSLERVQDFMSSNPDLMGDLNVSAERKQIDDAVTQIQEHITAQGTSERELAGANAEQRAIAKDLLRRHMAPIVKFARARLDGAPGFAALTVAGSPVAPKKLANAALSMAAAAKPYADVMTTAGFPSDTVDQLIAAAEALKAATLKRDVIRAGRVGSTTNIRTLLKQGRDGVQKLDAVIHKRFVDNQAVLDAWNSAKRIDAKPGVVRKKEQNAAPAVTTTVKPVTVMPATTPVIDTTALVK